MAEERTARIAGTRGGIEEGREGESQSGGGNAERGRAFMPRLSYIAPAAVGQSVNADKKVIPGAIHPKVLRERGALYKTRLWDEPLAFFAVSIAACREEGKGVTE